MPQTDRSFYFVGELPPPLTVNYKDRKGVLITTIAGATLTAETYLNEGSKADIDMTNNDDGTMTIDWPTSAPSAFTETGRMLVKIKVEPAGGGHWYLEPFVLPVKE